MTSTARNGVFLPPVFSQMILPEILQFGVMMLKVCNVRNWDVFKTVEKSSISGIFDSK